MPRHRAQYILDADADQLAQQLMREFDGDAALVAWGQADVEADCGHIDLSRKWIDVMKVILIHTPGWRRTCI